MDASDEKWNVRCLPLEENTDPIVAEQTSTGYGTAFGGVTALAYCA